MVRIHYTDEKGNERHADVKLGTFFTIAMFIIFGGAIWYLIAVLLLLLVGNLILLF